MRATALHANCFLVKTSETAAVSLEQTALLFFSVGLAERTEEHPRRKGKKKEQAVTVEEKSQTSTRRVAALRC